MANPSLYYGLIAKPMVTEKASVLQDLFNQYTFKVDARANKSEIRKAVETLFGVKVKSVNVMTNPGKIKRILGRPGRTRPWKKALVTLAAGEVIEIH